MPRSISKQPGRGIRGVSAEEGYGTVTGSTKGVRGWWQSHYLNCVSEQQTLTTHKTHLLQLAVIQQTKLLT